MKSNQSTLQELINEMQTLQTGQEEESTRLKRRLAFLEGRRREFFDVVTTDSADFENRRKLEEAERQVEEAHAQLARAEGDLKAELVELRNRIIELRNDELTRLEQERKAMTQRKAEVHNELLPEAMARVSALKEEEDRLTQRTEDITRRIRELDLLDLPSTQTV